jgi:TRAP-type C4-dicarboxylate transport system permease small subunit
MYPTAKADSMKKIIQFADLVGGLLIAILFLVVLLQVVARVILHVPTSWTVEFGRVLFVAIVFIGSVVLMYSHGHMVITTLLEKLSPRIKKGVEIFNALLLSLMLFIFCYGAVEKTVTNWDIVIPTLEWMTNGYMYLIVLLGGLGMLVCALIDLVALFRRST